MAPVKRPADAIPLLPLGSCAEPFWDTSTIHCSIEEGELQISGELCESCGED